MIAGDLKVATTMGVKRRREKGQNLQADYTLTGMGGVAHHDMDRKLKNCPGPLRACAG